MMPLISGAGGGSQVTLMVREVMAATANDWTVPDGAGKHIQKKINYSVACALILRTVL